jgi:hypothetical protein
VASRLQAFGGRDTYAPLAMKHTIDTGLPVADEKRALDKAMEAYKVRFAEYSPRFEWKSETHSEFGFNAKGVKLGGTITVRDKKIDVEMDVPFLFKIFQGKAMQVVTEEVQKWIDKVKAGEV